MMNKKNIAIYALALSIFGASSASAQREPVALEELPVIVLPAPEVRTLGEFGEHQYILKKRDKAPFPGVIVNSEGWSYILAEYQGVQDRANAALSAQRAEDLAFINLEVGKLNLELDATRRKSEVQIAGREADTKRCQTINKEILEDRGSLKRKLFIGVGAGTVGMVIGFIVGAFAM